MSNNIFHLNAQPLIFTETVFRLGAEEVDLFATKKREVSEKKKYHLK